MTLLQVSAVDSARFGLAVYRGRLANVDAKALAQEIFAHEVDVAMVRVPTVEASRLQQLTRYALPLLHADTLVYYRADLESLALGPLRNPDLAWSRARAADREELRALTLATFTGYVSHYHANPLFAPQDILAGYLEWAESHFDPAAGRSLWLARRRGQLVAFAACQDHAGSATGEGVLYGVHPDHAGGGIYGELIRYTMADFKARGFAHMTVSTQVGNFAVQKVWAREGFVMYEAFDTFHINALLSAKPPQSGRSAVPLDAPPRGAASNASKEKPAISVVVPVYNSAGTLPLLVERVQAVLRSAASEFELILVNDGSRDVSSAAIDELAQRHTFVRGIHLMRNYGQHNALLCGIRAARFSTIVTLDDDLQHPPEVIPELLFALREEVDVVYGVPQVEQHGLMRDLASQITKLALQSAMGAENARHVSAFRAFRTQLRDSFASYRSPFASIDVMLTWGTRRFAHVKVPHAPRLSGVSNYSVRQLLMHAINMMTGFSVLPLQLASMTGFGFTLFGVGILAFVLIRYFVLGGSIPGFPFLAAIIAIFSGAQLFALGVIGEYLARMHFRIMDKPTYVIRESTDRPRS